MFLQAWETYDASHGEQQKPLRCKQKKIREVTLRLKQPWTSLWILNKAKYDRLYSGNEQRDSEYRL